MSYNRVIITKFGGTEVLKVIEEAVLPEPKPGEVRVKVLVTSAAFTDVMIRNGKYPDVKEKPPFSPGYDMVGIVDKLGEGVTRFKAGQRVADLTIIGAYSEYICLPESRLIPVPDGLDSAEAVSLILSYVTAYQMLHRVAKVKQGQHILVHGAGGAVGTAMLQLGNLLRNLAITRPNQVWSTDITYIPMRHGFMYLVAIMDWYSRYVVTWQLSNALDGRFCLEALEQALAQAQPEIFNTDQGAQFTALEFTSRLEAAGVHISMDGRGRALDNVFIERLWRSVKYEHVYLYAYAVVPELEKGLNNYFTFYNHKRPHQSLAYQTPAEVHFAGVNR